MKLFREIENDDFDSLVSLGDVANSIVDKLAQNLAQQKRQSKERTAPPPLEVRLDRPF